MVTLVTKTIGTTGRDYSTLDLWEADTDNDLTIADEQHDGEMYDDSDFSAGTAIGGATVDSTRYRRLLAADGEEYNGLTGTGALVTGAALFIGCSDEFTQFLNFGIICTGTSQTQLLRLRQSDMLIQGMWVDNFTNTDGSSNTLDTGSNGNNCIIQNTFCRGSDIVFDLNAGSVSAYNCIADGERDAGALSFSNLGFDGNSASLVHNCIGIGKNTDFDIDGEEDYCASEDGTAIGANSVSGISVSLTFWDQSTGDYRPKTLSSPQINTGIDVSSIFTESYEPGVSHGSGSTNWEMGIYDESATPQIRFGQRSRIMIIIS